jgi:hypothetical protein
MHRALLPASDPQLDGDLIVVDAIARSIMRTPAAVEHGYIVRLVQLSTPGFTLPYVHVDVADLGMASTACSA